MKNRVEPNYLHRFGPQQIKMLTSGLIFLVSSRANGNTSNHSKFMRCQRLKSQTCQTGLMVHTALRFFAINAILLQPLNSWNMQHLQDSRSICRSFPKSSVHVGPCVTKAKLWFVNSRRQTQVFNLGPSKITKPFAQDSRPSRHRTNPDSELNPLFGSQPM